MMGPSLDPVRRIAPSKTLATNGSGKQTNPIGTRHRHASIVRYPINLVWLLTTAAVLQLWDHYMLTVGRGEALILNMPPDTTGRIPKEYAAETAKFGQALKGFNTPVAEVGCSPASLLACSLLAFPTCPTSQTCG